MEKKIGKKFNISFTILRLYQVYGPNQTNNRLIPIVINSCLKDKKFSCTSGKQIRDFLYVDDLIKLIIKIIKKKPRNKIYNVGAGNKLKVKKVIELINKMTGSGEPLFGKIKMRKDEMNNNFPDISKIKKEYNWKPNTNIRSGIRNTISFYESTKKHQVNTPIIDQAYEMIENGKRPDKALQDLLSRDLRPETDY